MVASAPFQNMKKRLPPGKRFSLFIFYDYSYFVKD
jgi:hypothetical protein